MVAGNGRVRPLAHLNTVMLSFTAPGDLICVDILRSPEGQFGFQQYRRDPEDGRGWHVIGAPVRFIFDSAQAALDQARRDLDWLEGADQASTQPAPSRSR